MSGFEQAATDSGAAPAPDQGTPTFTQAPVTAAGPTATALEDGSVVVNGKIYKPEAAAKKIDHADQHIETLEREAAEKDNQLLTVLERLEALEKDRKHTDALDSLVANAQPTPAPAPAPAPEPAPTQEISKEEIVQAAVDTMEGQRVAEQQEANLRACVAEAQGLYGDGYGFKVDTLAGELGLSVDDALEYARNRPVVFRQLFLKAKGPDGTPDTTQSTVNGTFNNAGIAPTKQSFMKMSAKQRAQHVQDKMKALSNP